MPLELVAATVEAPGDEAGLIEIVREAGARREPLLVEGRGTKRGMLRPVQAAQTLSTRGLSGVTLYSPKELIVSARAGTTVAELEAALAEGGQGLVAEPPDLSALLGTSGGQTIGGMVAANLSGPRRVAWGAMRDHLMGVRAVNGAAELIRSGGRVLKNVTGLDLCKLIAGSHGTLAVLTEVTLKVLPIAERTGSLMVTGLGAPAGVAALSAALGSPYGVSGTAWLPGAAAARVEGLGQDDLAIIRIEDFTPSVVYRLACLREVPGWTGARLLEHEESLAVWRAIRDAAPLEVLAGDAVWRVSVRPSAGPAVAAAVSAMGGRCFLDWGGGLAWVAGAAALHDRVMAAARAGGGTWTLLHGPETMRAAVEVVPTEPEPLQRITRRVKAAMDPLGILNPGRLYAGL